jgi:multiple sugar transport system ATP-binding protein
VTTTVTYRAISKMYGDVEALKALDLGVEDGEFLVLVGPSGCGKSTLLRMTAGLEEITSGDLEIAGVRVNDLEPAERDVAMVFQNYALYPHRTVRGNLSYALKLRGMAKGEIQRKVDAVAEMLEISELLDRRPSQLSGGQAQRVALGRAIVRQPKVFLMDEPLSNLDAKLRAQMRTELIRLHREVRTTTIYVTHDQVEAMTMGSRIVVLDHGVLQQVGTPREIYQRPANLFVATFMGAPPMNILPSRIETSEDGMVVRADGITAPVPAHLGAQVAGAGIDREVRLGLRPEALSLGDITRPVDDEVAIEGTVDVVELLGGEAYIHVLTGAGRVTAKVGSDAHPAAGAAVRLRTDPANVHLFDPATTSLIGTGKPGVAVPA